MEGLSYKDDGGDDRDHEGEDEKEKEKEEEN